MEKELLQLLNDSHALIDVYELGLFAALASHLVVLVENDIYVPEEDI